MHIRCKSREVKLEPDLWLPAIFPWKIPGGEFASKCSRIIQRDTVYRSMNGVGAIPGIDLHVFVGVEGFASERTHRKFPIPFGLSLYRKKEQRGACQGNCSHSSPGKLCHIA